jgi:hypothetical protein
MQADLLSSMSPAAQGAARVLAGLARFQGTAEAFWPVYLRAIGEALPARRVLLLTSAVGRPWQARAQWASGAADHDDDAQWTLDLVGRASPALPLVLRNEHDELALAMLPGRSAEGTGPVAAVVALAVDAGVWDEPSLQTWATLVASIPSVWLASTAGEPAAVPSASPDDDRGAAGQVGSAGPVPDEVLRRAERVHEVLQTSLRLQQQDRFMALAMAVCNEIALQYRCERVSLGWVKGHYVRCRRSATSRTSTPGRAPRGRSRRRWRRRWIRPACWPCRRRPMEVRPFRPTRPMPRRWACAVPW